MSSAAHLFDACAMPQRSQHCAICLDTLVDGVHFTADTPAAVVGYKSVAVNLSDLAAMGATPLALHGVWGDPQAAPDCASGWSDDVQAAILEAAAQAGMSAQLRRSATRRRQVSVQLVGEVAAGCALRRDGARIGDRLWVSGTLGDAGAGLQLSQRPRSDVLDADRQWLLSRLWHPVARVALGRALRGIASAVIDVSDGIVGDAAHIAARSKVGVRIVTDDLPLSATLCRAFERSAASALALGAGEDYELLFTAPADADGQVLAAGRQADVTVTCIGAVTAGDGVALVDGDGRALPATRAFDHFSQPAD